MIDTAYIIGQLGKAIYLENGRYFVFGIESAREPSECRSGDVSFLLDSASDILAIDSDGLTVSRIEAILKEETLSHKALVLMLTGLDGELSRETRSRSVRVVESLLEEESVLRFLKVRMFARALPPNADIRGAIGVAKGVGARKVASLCAEIEKTQKGIHALQKAWNEASQEMRLTDSERINIEQRLIDHGVFADMASALSRGDEVQIQSTISRLAVDQEFNKLSFARRVLMALKDHLLEKNALDDLDFPTPEGDQSTTIASMISASQGGPETSAPINTKHKDADLILKLYELRRESVMREARNWFFTFNPETPSEFFEAMLGPHSGHLRMVISYWDMAAALVVNGAIDETMFNETNGEHVFVFAKIEPILGELRRQMDQPEFLKNYETLIYRIPNIRETLAKLRQRIAMMQSMMERKESGAVASA
jgi:hypothetical protein